MPSWDFPILWVRRAVLPHTTNTPSPLDGFEEEYSIKESIIAMKKVTDKDVRRLVRKVSWVWYYI